MASVCNQMKERILTCSICPLPRRSGAFRIPDRGSFGTGIARVLEGLSEAAEKGLIGCDAGFCSAGFSTHFCTLCGGLVSVDSSVSDSSGSSNMPSSSLISVHIPSVKHLKYSEQALFPQASRTTQPSHTLDQCIL